MNEAGDGEDYYCAYGGCHDYGSPLSADEVEATHQGDACRDKEESEIGDEEVGGSFYMVWLYDAELE